MGKTKKDKAGWLFLGGAALMLIGLIILSGDDEEESDDIEFKVVETKGKNRVEFKVVDAEGETVAEFDPDKKPQTETAKAKSN